jgi:ABC-type branched-subunit amino acid transport system substrate-binding protein
VIAYDAAGVVYSALDHAIRAAGGHVPPRANLISQLAETTRYEGATGTFGFDPAGDTTHRVISIVRSPRRAATAPWTFAGSVDYTAALPY